MKLEQLAIEGYKSLRNVQWSPAQLNVLIGSNGCGKSNVLRALELISASAQGRLSKYVQSEGGMGLLVWDGRTEDIRVAVNCKHDEDTNVTYDFELSRVGKSSGYQFRREVLLALNDNETWIERNKSKASLTLGGNNGARLYPTIDVPEEESALSQLVGPSANDRNVSPFLKYLSAWRVYKALDVSRDAEIRQSPIARYETLVDPDGRNLTCVLHTLYTGNREFKHDIHLAMNAVFGEEFEELTFPPAADQRIQLRVRWKSLRREQSTAELSDGTLRFLYLISVLSAPDPPPLIAIDEPDIGLHPSMLAIVAEYAESAALRTQVILTTHSPEFLSAFDQTPQTTVLKSIDGETKLATIDGVELQRWLKEFSLGSLYSSGELEEILADDGPSQRLPAS